MNTHDQKNAVPTAVCSTTCETRNLLSSLCKWHGGAENANDAREMCCAVEILHYLVYNCSDVPGFLSACRTAFEHFEEADDE